MDGLETKAWGLRFVSADVERDYRSWHRQQALPFARIGMVAALINWAAVLGGVWVFHVSAAEPFTLPCLAEMVLIIGIFAASHRPGGLPWVAPATAFANVTAGALVVYICWLIALPPIYATLGLLLVAQFGFTIFRLRAEWAVAAVASYSVPFTIYGIVAGTDPWIPLVMTVGFFGGLLANLVMNQSMRSAYRQERTIAAQAERIEHERSRAEELLHSILPAPIAERLKASRQTISDQYEEVTVLFADVVGFTTLAEKVTPARLVEILNEVFTRFDALAAAHGVEKIKTIGDAYMAVAGVPTASTDSAHAAARLALSMREELRLLAAGKEHGIQVRIGMSTGPVVAGVIGARKFAYDLWGDTVNTAARMEQHGLPGEIQVSQATFEHLKGRFQLTERGAIEIKGKGPMPTWLLVGSLP